MNASPVRLGSRRVVTPSGVRNAVVEIEAGRVTRVMTPGDAAGLDGLEDLGDLVLLPGLVDTHVHMNEPGRAEWEGFASGTRAALAGGITTVVDMPLNSVPATTTAEALTLKKRAALEHAVVDVGFWGGVVPGNARELEALADAGALGFKCFLVDSGVPEFEAVTERDLRASMPIIARLGLPLLVHAELPGPIAAAAQRIASADARAYATWLASRPPEAECEAVRLMIRLCEETGCHVHIVHLSAAAALPDLCEARAQALPLTVETCPHYLVFGAEAIRDGALALKCAPPIRSRANREHLWTALAEGDIDLIASDHSPCPPALKGGDTGDFMRAWGGIASLELGLSAIWTTARKRGFKLGDVARWMAEAPAKLAGLAGRKGAIIPGADADLVLFDPDRTWTVDAASLKQRHAVTPYAGARMVGRVTRVWRHGVLSYRLTDSGAPADLAAGLHASPRPGIVTGHDR